MNGGNFTNSGGGEGSPNLCKELESFEVLLSPADIIDHLLESADGKCIAGVVIRDRYPSAFRVNIQVVASLGSCQDEAVFAEGGDQFSGGQAARDAGHTVTATLGE